MHWKVFGFVIIAFIIIYNLAAESAASSTDPTVMAMYGTWVQAGAAVITLCIMICLGIRQTKIAEEQKEMTRRQIDLGLFDKRYSIYCSVKDIVHGLFEIEYPEQGSDTWDTVDKYLEYNEQACKSIEACDNTILDKLAADFLIDDSGEEIIRNLKGNIGKYIGLICRQKEHESNNARREIIEAETEINGSIAKFHEYMKKYLDFTKI